MRVGALLVIAAAVAACSKEGPGIPLAAGVDEGPPPPAWDWWKRPSCPAGTRLVDKTFEGGIRQVWCDRDSRADGPFASIHDGRVHVGSKRAGVRVGRWPIYDERGELLEVRTYDRDEVIYGSIVHDGAPLVARASNGCDTVDQIAAIAGKDTRDVAGCTQVYGYFPGIAQAGIYAPDAGCVDRVWVIDCKKADAPPPKDLLARAGWARAKGPAREALALRYVEAFSDYVRLPDDAKAVAAPDGSVTIDAWVTRTQPGEDPISYREHRIWTFSPAGDVSLATLESKRAP